MSVKKKAGDAPDGLRSWIVALSCCCIHALAMGLTRMAGVFLVASVKKFGITREEASFPFTVAVTIRYMGSPVAGILGRLFGVRLITCAGVLLASLGLSLSYLATNIFWIKISYGIIFGVGYCLAISLLPVAINQYFDKYRATACGISYSGACIGSFLLPALISLLLNHYDLNGTFLILSGIFLNCLALAMFLGEPNFAKTQEDDVDKIQQTPDICLSLSETDDKTKVDVILHGGMAPTSFVKSEMHPFSSLRAHNPPTINNPWRPQVKVRCQSCNSNSNSELELNITKLNLKETVPPFPIKDRSTSCGSYISVCGSKKGSILCRSSTHGGCSCTACCDLMLLEEGGKVQPIATVCVTASDATHGVDKNGKLSVIRLESLGSEKHHPVTLQTIQIAEDASIEEDMEDVSKTHTLEAYIRVFLNPIYLLTAITCAMYGFTFYGLMTVIVDFAEDIGISPEHSKYVLMCFSIGDFAGRLGLGFVTDMGCMSKTSFITICCLLQTVVLCFSFSTCLMHLIAVITVYSIAEAGILLISPSIIADFVEEELQTIAIASHFMLSAPLGFAMPYVIGHFRDQSGSYVGLFYSMAAFSLACAIAWVVAAYSSNRRQKTSKA